MKAYATLKSGYEIRDHHQVGKSGREVTKKQAYILKKELGLTKDVLAKLDRKQASLMIAALVA